MQRSFEEIGLELSPGSFFGSFSGSVTFEWDETGQEVVAVEIVLSQFAGKPCAIPIHYDHTHYAGLYGHLFTSLERSLLNHFRDDADMIGFYERAAKMELRYGHLQKERL